MFIDKADIIVYAGKGGNGENSFYRDKYTRPGKKGKGRPDGGDGGCGGNLIIEADVRMHTLLDFHYRREFRAEGGTNGQGNGRRGRGGADLILKVAQGTVVKDKARGTILRDFKSDKERVIVASGGAGGKGNIHAETATKGEPGEQREISLELKLIADTGIIGFPNAGKSTLLSVISQARPKIAPYPFTTKNPILGIVKHHDVSFVAADIPGLIEDAHRGKGLGFEFLRHIERTRILIHLIDMSGISGRDPVEDYCAINKELGFYSQKLLDKPQILVANKIDLEGSLENLKTFKKKIKVEIIAISAQKKENLGELLNAVCHRLQAYSS